MEGAGESGRSPGVPNVKWQLPPHLPVGLGLKEIIHESACRGTGPMEVLINVPAAAGVRGPGAQGLRNRCLVLCDA